MKKMSLRARGLCLFVSACALLWCMASGSACSGEEEYSKQQRLDNMRALIDAQLSRFAIPDNETEEVIVDDLPEVNQTVIDMYWAVANISEQVQVPTSWHDRDSCQASAFFAKRVHTFPGTMVPTGEFKCMHAVCYSAKV